MLTQSERNKVVLLLACSLLLSAGSGTGSAQAPAEQSMSDWSLPTATEDESPATGAEFPATLSARDDESESRGLVTTKSSHFIDYDTDDDGLIDISTLAQLDAVRHDLDGDGSPSNDGETTYAEAFPDAASGMGCPTTGGCSGYELMVDLDFDTNGSGRADTGDTYWNDGQGWVPIGGAGSIGTPRTGGAVTRRNPFHATFEGNGHTIANLFVHSEDALFAGLFGYAGYDSSADSYSIIRRVGMIGVELSGYNYIGGLVGWNEGAVLSSYATGQISGRYGLGGLVGLNRGSIVSSYATVSLFGRQILTQTVGGLVGTNETTSGGSTGGLPESRRGLVAGSYATGRVQAYNFAGGLVGNNDGTISACYATGRVRDGGGLAGRNSGTISFSYSTGQASSSSLPHDALVQRSFGIIDYSYFDSRTTLWFFSSLRSVNERTTEQLQEPTGYSGLYRLWNVDLDGDNSADDPWHFGTTSQYPVLRADLNGDGRATWQEFGYQVREGPTLSATTALRDGETQVDLKWTGVNTGHWNPAPSVTYTLRRDTYPFYQLRNVAEGLNALSYTDTVTPRYRDFNSNRYAYQVAAVVSGGEATHSVPSYLQPDTQAPSVREMRLSGDSLGSAAAVGDEIWVSVDFSENLVITGQPQLTLELGGGQRTAIFQSISTLNNMTFVYTVASGDMDSDGVSVPAGRIDLNGGTIEDEAGNPALLDYQEVDPNLSHKVDGVKPMLLGAAVNQALLALTYGEGLRSGSWNPDKDDFTVEVGGVKRSVSSLTVNGGVVELTLGTAVGSGDTGITVSYTPGSRPIQDLVGNQADDLNDQPVANTTGASNTAPEVTSSAVFTTAENRTERWRMTAADSDDGDEVTGWEISGGADRGRFWIDEVTGDFGFSQAPDYEMPADQANPAGDNRYVVMVRVTSGAGSRAMTAQQEIRVTVEDEDEPPGVPQTLFISQQTLDGLKVEWTAPDIRGSGISGYVVRYRKVDGGGFTEVQAGTELIWTLTGLDEDTIYEVQVQATNHEGAGPWSESVRGRTDAPLTVEITSLEESPVEGPFTLRIAFSEAVTGFDSNDIEIQVETDCTDSGNNPLDCIPGRGTLRYPDGAGAFSGPTFGLTLTPRTDEVAGNYTLGIRIAAGSVQTSGGDHSNREATLQVRVLVPGAMAPEPISSLGLEASRGTRSVMLIWDLPSDNGGSAIVRYEYRYATVGEGLGPWRSVGAEKLGVTVGNLAGGREYVFEVRAVNGLGKGPIETVRATPLAGGEGETESLFVPVILSAAGRNQSFFTSELTLTNRGEEATTLNYTYTAEVGGGGTASDVLRAGRQMVAANALTYLAGLGMPIPETGNRIGTLRVEVPMGSDVQAVVRTSTVVPDGRAGLAYLGIAEEEGFSEAVYLCGLRQNTQDRSNVAFQHMGAPGDGPITLRTTIYSGEEDDTRSRMVGEVELQPGGFHQYNEVLKALGRSAQGYVKVEKVSGDAPFYAYGVINDNFNSDGSFVFPLTASSLVGTKGQTLPVIIETGNFQSELTVTNFSATDRTVRFSFVAEAVATGDDTAEFSLTLEAGEQLILPDIVEILRQFEVEGIGPANRAYVGAVFARAAEGDMSGIVIGARTGSPDKRGGQYSLFYNGVPYGAASVESAWIYGLQQNEENRSNLALVNTGEIDDSPSTFEITIYDGSGESQPRTRSVTLGARRWRQENGILGRISQGYVQVRKVSGNNPFITYGVINDGGAPGERSGDGAYLPARE